MSLDNIDNFSIEEQEAINCLIDKSRRLKDLGATAFESLLVLETGLDSIKEILERYQRQNLVERFNIMLQNLVQHSAILASSDDIFLVFYKTLSREIDIDNYLDLFSKGTFARSFLSQMSQYTDLLVSKFSDEELLVYQSMKDAYMPIPLEDFIVARAIVDRIREVHDKRRFLYAPINRIEE